jgi:hypothetical protein
VSAPASQDPIRKLARPAKPPHKLIYPSTVLQALAEARASLAGDASAHAVAFYTRLILSRRAGRNPLRAGT